MAVSKRAGIAVEELAERRLDLDADDRIVRPGHADVGQIRGALRQNALVGGLHVRVRADDGRDLAVEMPAHRDLLRRRLGVEVHEDDPRARLERLDLLQHDRERIVDVRHEDAAHDVDHADGPAVLGAREIAAVAGHAGGVVGRPQQARLGADVVERFLLVPDVIARRHHVDAPVEELVADFAGDAEAGRGVLGVGDDEVDASGSRRAPPGPGGRARARAARRCRR